MSVREGMQTDAVRDVAGALLDLAGRTDGMRDSGAAMLRLLSGVWEGEDVARFQQGWEAAGPRMREAAEGLRGAGEELRRQVDDQVATSGGEGGGSGGGDRGRGWPDLDLPDLDFPDLGNPFEGMGWGPADFFSWPDIDWGGLWEGFLDVLEDIGDWWDELPLWAQIVIGVVAAAVIVVIAILAGVEIVGALAVVAAIAAVAGVLMTILDMLDAVAEFLRDPEAAIRRFLDDPLAFLDDLVWLAVGFLPFGIGKILGRFRKPIKELLEGAAPWLKRKGDEIVDWFRRKKDDVARKLNDWDKQIRRKYGLGAKKMSDPPPNTFPSGSKVQKKYAAHAKDFGLVDERGKPLPWNKENGERFRKAVDDHISDPATAHYDGYYRGKPAILDYNAKTGLVTVRSPNGDFISGWKASAAQAENITKRGSLQ